MQAHELAEIFPMMQGSDLSDLINDIRDNGLLEAIVTFEGKILDGRNRHIACVQAQVEPRFQEFEGGDPLAFVLSRNLHRRHLKESQRAMVANNVATMRQGERTDQHSADLQKVSQSEAAEKLNVSTRMVAKAKKVKCKADPVVVKAVEDGELPLEVAEKLTDETPEVQQSVAKAENPKAELKKIKRAKKAENLKQQVSDLPDKKYPVIYADPPWRFETRSENGMDRAADNHYPTMTLEDIADLPLRTLSMGDCVLFLWATVPMLPQALEVLISWGFEYKSQIVWAKDRIGTGYWTRNKHEILLIATKGQPIMPEPGSIPESCVLAPVGKHSAKPSIFRQIIWQMYPDLPKLEMFARSKSAGWDVWGNESETEESDNGFEEWWSHSPRKVGKGGAARAYKTALKKAGRNTLLACWQAYAESVRGKDPQYIVHPATWLNQERWGDDAPADDDEELAELIKREMYR